MRKFPQPACLVLGISVLLASAWTFAREVKIPGSRGLDSGLNWQIARSDERLIAVARVNQRGLTATSTNGRDWQVEKTLCGFNAVAHGHGKFVAVGESGAAGVTTTGENWRITSITTYDLSAIFFAGECFVANGCPPLREFFTSRDGFFWKRHAVTAEGPAARIGEFLETRVTGSSGATGTDSAAEPALTSIANEVRTLRRAQISGK